MILLVSCLTILFHVFGVLIFLFCCTFLLKKDENKTDFKKIAGDNWIEPPKRERKRKYDF